jgi:hypothetical protein
MVKSQSLGSIDGYIYSCYDSVLLPQAQISIKAGDKQYWALSNEQGYFVCKAIDVGTYTVEISYSSYAPKKISKVPVNSNQKTSLGSLFLNSITIEGAEIIEYVDPLIQDNGGLIVPLPSKQWTSMPNPTDIASVLASISSEFYVSEDNSQIHFRGSRDDMTAYYIDGVRVSSTEGIPKGAIRSLTLYSGGVPAKYGDFTGGVVVIETVSYSEWFEETNRIEEYWREKYAKENNKSEQEYKEPVE